MPRKLACGAKKLSLAILVALATAYATLSSASAQVGPIQPRGQGTGTTYYVSGSGNDGNDGRSTARAFRTLQRAANVVNPGDVVSIMNGTFSNSNSWGFVMDLKRGGTADRWVTIKAHAGQSPKIYVKNWAGINVGSSYVVIEGLTITGNLFEINQAYANSQKKNLANPVTSGNGIVVKSLSGGIPHHVLIRNNNISNVPGAGVSVIASDYVAVQNNTVRFTSWWSPFAQSGISIFEPKSWDGNTGTKIYVTGNTVQEVDNKVPFFATNTFTDGHAIIVDRSNVFGYNGRISIAYNNASRIGARGANIYASKNVEVIGNRFSQTSLNPIHTKGNIGVISSQNVLLQGNQLENPNHHIWNSSVVKK